MDRRKVLKNVWYFSLGAGILYSCSDPYSAIKKLTLQRLNIDDDAIKSIDTLSTTILPLQEIPALANHTSLPFILKNINDLYSDEKLAVLLSGISKINSYFVSLYGTNFLTAAEETRIDFINRLNQAKSKKHHESTATKDVVKYLFDILKKENLFYLRTTEYIQREMRFYEMAPGRYDGSYPLQKLLAKSLAHE